TSDTRTVTVTGVNGTGTVGLDLSSTSPAIQDGVGNPLQATHTSDEFYSVDTIAPTVTSITRADANPTSNSTVHFTVTFSEPVTAVATANFTVSGGIGGSVTAISGSGATRTVTVTGLSGMGTVGLDLSSASPAINDSLGNALTATHLSDELYTVDTDAPTVSS